MSLDWYGGYFIFYSILYTCRMIPYIEWIEFSVGPLTLYTWGTCVALGYLAGLLLTRWLAHKQGMKEQVVLSLFLWVFVASMVGSRALYVLLYWDLYAQRPWSVFAVQDGGLVMLGGFVAAILASLWVAKRHAVSVWALADVAAPGLALGLAIGRVGCFLINDHPGAITHLPWAIIWPDGTERHPVALYLIVWNSVLFWVLLWAFRRSQTKQWKQGSVAWIFLGLYGAGRFALDFTRATDVIQADPRWMFMTVSQWLGLALCIAAVAMLVHGIVRRRRVV